jgi:hypothetical protein
MTDQFDVVKETSVEAPPISRIRRPKPVPVRTLWPSEPEDFTPWLADNLEELDILRIGSLSLIETEKNIPGTGRSLDILAETGEGHLVAIENQYSMVDHDHLTRGLAYAVGLKAKALVVIAEGHADEFRAIARYLNDCAEQRDDEGISVFLVDLSVVAIEDYFMPRFDVVERPNAWIEAVEANKPNLLTSIEQFLEQCPDETRDAFRQIINDWLGDPANEGARAGYNAILTVALYRANPLKSGRQETAVYLLETSGRFVVNRGYLLDAGLGGTDEDIAAFDNAFDQFFPNTKRTGKFYHPGVSPDPVAVRGFSQWLANRISEKESELNPGATP